jgi:hypothetical protein
MTRSLSWLLMLLLAGVFASVVAYALWLRVRGGRDMPEYSVYSESRDGLSEAARFLRNIGFEPVAVTRPIGALNYRGLLILAEPSKPQVIGSHWELSEADARALLNWVAAGNSLLYCGRHPTALHDQLGAYVVSDDKLTANDPHDAEVDDAGLYTDEVNGITVEGRHHFGRGAGLPIWSVDGLPGAVLIRHGKGRVLLCADGSLLTNHGLGRADNGVFLYNVALRDARGGKVFFDEYHHGLRSGGGVWGYLSYHHAQWVFAPIVLLLAIAAWAAAVRLGPAVPIPEAARADAVDYASAVARIYQRAGVLRRPARALVRGFLARLTRHLRLRRNALPAEILHAWKEQHPADSGRRLQSLLRGVTALRKGEVSEVELLEWSRAFDAFQTEMMRVR